ncbi:MAG TPA: CHASE3 domain-containing protein, partial [Polyangiaceae bacterium]
MLINWTFGRKLAFGFAIAALTLIVIGISGYRSTEHLIDNDRWVSHTHEVRTKLADLISSLKDAETGMRGFVITGDESFLEPYTRALPDIAKTTADIHSLTSDNPTQQRRMSTLGPLIDTRLVEVKRAVDLRRTTGLEAALKLIATGEGKATMDQVRRVIADMDDDEAGLLTRRNADAEQSSESTKSVIFWGSL